MTKGKRSIDGHKSSDKIETDCIWVSPEKKQKRAETKLQRSH